jgi:hypothetical protein
MRLGMLEVPRRGTTELTLSLRISLSFTDLLRSPLAFQASPLFALLYGFFALTLVSHDQIFLLFTCPSKGQGRHASPSTGGGRGSEGYGAAACEELVSAGGGPVDDSDGGPLS